MAGIARKTKRYPSDLTDEEWERMAPAMPKPARRGRARLRATHRRLKGHDIRCNGRKPNAEKAHP